MTKTVEEIKREVAEREGCACSEVRCSHCTCWAYNNGGTISSVGSSRCKDRKQRTDSYQFCRNFKKI